MKPLRLLLFGLTLLSLCSCMTFLNPSGDWPGIGKDFLKQMRWGEYDAAAAFFAEEQQASFRAQTETRDRLQIVDGHDYRLFSPAVGDGSPCNGASAMGVSGDTQGDAGSLAHRLAFSAPPLPWRRAGRDALFCRFFAPFIVATRDFSDKIPLDLAFLFMVFSCILYTKLRGSVPDRRKGSLLFPERSPAAVVAGGR